MVKGRGPLAAKYILFGINLLFGLVGLTILTLEALSVRSERKYSILSKSDPIAGLGLTIVMECFYSVVGFIGCFGASTESYHMLQIYSMMAFIVLVISIAKTVFSFTVKAKEKYALYQSIKEYNVSSLVQELWDDLQKNDRCCGVESYKDWGDNIPKSCCKKRLEKDQECASKHFFKRGCWKMPSSTSMVILKTVFMVLVIVLACYLSNAIKEQEKQERIQ